MSSATTNPTHFLTTLPPASVEERALFSASVRMLSVDLNLREELLVPLPSGDYDSPLVFSAWRTWQIRAQLPVPPDDEREAFEKAYRSLRFSPRTEGFGRGSQDEYFSTHIDIAWRTWQQRAVLDAWQRLPGKSTFAPAPAPAEGVTG